MIFSFKRNCISNPFPTYGILPLSGSTPIVLIWPFLTANSSMPIFSTPTGERDIVTFKGRRNVSFSLYPTNCLPKGQVLGFKRATYRIQKGSFCRRYVDVLLTCCYLVDYIHSAFGVMLNAFATTVTHPLIDFFLLTGILSTPIYSNTTLCGSQDGLGHVFR